MDEGAQGADARRVELFKLRFETEHALIGGAAYDAHGEHFPEATKRVCDGADAILYGSVGGPVDEQHLPKWKDAEKNAVLGIRNAFDLAVNIRPATRVPGGGARVAAALRDRRARRRHADHPRAARRPLFRRAQDRRRHRARRVHVHGGADPPAARLRLRRGEAAARQAHRRRQGERARHEPAVAAGGDGDAQGPSGGRARVHVRRQRGDAARSRRRATSTSSPPRTSSATSCRTPRRCCPARSG